jgi:hypothetical protein
MEMNSFRRNLVKLTKVIVIVFLFLTSINALISGFLFIIDPSGNLMGMTTEYLKTSPFTSFLIPGIVLFTVNGVLNLVAAITLIKNKAYASLLTIFQGIILIGWIIIQVLMVKDINMLHISMFVFGVLFVLGGWIMKRFR